MSQRKRKATSTNKRKVLNGSRAARYQETELEEEGDNIDVGGKLGVVLNAQKNGKHGHTAHCPAGRAGREAKETRGALHRWLVPRKATGFEEKENTSANIASVDDDNVSSAEEDNTGAQVNRKPVRRVLSHVEIIVPPRAHRRSFAQHDLLSSHPTASASSHLPPVSSRAAPPSASSRLASTSASVKVASASSRTQPTSKSPHSSFERQSTASMADPPSEPASDSGLRRSSRRKSKVNYREDGAPNNEDAMQTDSDVYTQQASERESDPDDTMSNTQSDSTAGMSTESDTQRPFEKKRKATTRGSQRDINSEPPSKKSKSTRSRAQNVGGPGPSTTEPKAKVQKTSKRMLNLLRMQDHTGIWQSLPPISSITEIFEDITSKAIERKLGGLKESIDALARSSRPLRVATMCSGTESPLLALEMIKDSLDGKGFPDVRIEHVFSAEIVPYKQAYIERNFRPPVIFRDITEITRSEDEKATTAYGARVKIPGNVDMVIAGTACVDFSRLNNYKKDLDDAGESGDTFKAVLQYAKKYRPSILVLENVKGAPWDTMIEMYEAEGYACTGALVDTKLHYLPQTRQRGYMVCFNNRKAEGGEADDQESVQNGDSVKAMLKTWEDVMKDLRRPASSPVSSFLLPNDDPSIINSRKALTSQSALDGPIKETDWAKCEIRHVKYRVEEQLGNARPLTGWQESGTVNVPEYSDRTWWKRQGERVWDFADMSLLRKALPKDKNPTSRYDVQYKTRVWDVSQNIDRFTDGAKFGIVPCLTPSGIFFVTDRGGPFTYTESLILQGLPLQKISFTTETERQIQDLAGNAMSTPVVGSAIIAALIAGHRILPDRIESSDEDQGIAKRQAPQTGLEIVEAEHVTATQYSPQSSEGSVGKSMTSCLDELLDDAIKSSGKCQCEGRIHVAERPIQTCEDCGHTSCVACGVKPRHKYQDPEKSARDHPESFIQKWRPQFPALISFVNVAHLEGFLVSQRLRKPSAPKSAYVQAVIGATKEPLALKELRRLSHWTAVYESPAAKLEFAFGSGLEQPEWRLYAKPSPKLAGNHELRKFLELPIAKSTVDETSFFGQVWHWRVPDTVSCDIEIRGEGKLTPSWAARLNLPTMQDEQMYSMLHIQSAGDLDTNEEISGVYQHLPDCGTACGSLYKRVDRIDSEDMFFFLDPSRIGDPKNDSFVFAHDHSKLEYDEIREVVASIDSDWRPWTFGSEPLAHTRGWSDGRWVTEQCCSLTDIPSKQTVTILDDSLFQDDCSVSKAIASCGFEVPFAVDSRFQGCQYIDAGDKAYFETFAWALEPLRQDLGFADINNVPNGIVGSCNSCAPMLPEVRWNLSRSNSGKDIEICPYEDPETADNYEVALRRRPPIFVVKSTIVDGIAEVQIGANVLSLCQRAIAKLSRLTSVPGTVSWSLDTMFVPDVSAPLPKFSLNDNGAESEFEEDIFQIRLFPKQQQSLSWMINQEKGLGQEFALEEVEEASLPYLGWRLEALATSTVRIRGGILADHAGFGKTITSLGLIHSEFRQRGSAENIKANMKDLTTDNDGHVLPRKIAATLVVCPGGLVNQWQSEVSKVLGAEYHSRTIKINSMKELYGFTVKDFEKARIILVNRGLFESQEYRNRLAVFGGVPECMLKGGRAARSWLNLAARDVPKHLELLENEGVETLKARLKEVYREHLADQTLRAFAEQSKRHRGQSYVDKNAGQSTERSTKESIKTAHMSIESLVTEQKLEKVNFRNYLLFEMFYFNRVVVDEFSYLDSLNLMSFGAIKADKRWGLSATPQLKDPYDVSRMANLLGLELPIGASAPGLISESNVKALCKDMTNAEQIEISRNVASRVVQDKVHALSQKFLDSFVRQNIQGYNERPYTDYLVPLRLNVDQRVAYTDVSQKLLSQDMRMRKGAQSKIELVKGNPTSAEEALSKMAGLFSHFGRRTERAESSATELSDASIADAAPNRSAIFGLELMVQNRVQDRDAARDDLKTKIRQSRQRSAKLALEPSNDPFVSWASSFRTGNAFGDQSVTDAIKEMIDPPSRSKASAKSKAKNDDEDESNLGSEDEDNNAGNKKGNQSKDEISDISKSVKTYLAATRSARFVEKALEFDRHRRVDNAPLPRCDDAECCLVEAPLEDLRVSAACGHVICVNCYERSTETLGLCRADGCEKEVRWYHLLHPSMMDESVVSAHGKKAEHLVELLQEIQDKDDQAIVFAQYEDQIDELQVVLKDNDIRCTVSGKSGANIEKFQSIDSDNKSKTKRGTSNKGKAANSNSNTNGRKITVLILNVSDVSAAGTNLANANHVIFFSPLLKETQYEYDAQMAQGIGRIRRPGQKKKMFVYHMVSLNTIDVDILEQRERRHNILTERLETDDEEDHHMELDQIDDGRPILDSNVRLEKPERTQLIYDSHDGKYKLVPRSMLVDGDCVEGRDRVKGYRNFNSLMKFSRAFADEE